MGGTWLMPKKNGNGKKVAKEKRKHPGRKKEIRQVQARVKK